MFNVMINSTQTYFVATQPQLTNEHERCCLQCSLYVCGMYRLVVDGNVGKGYVPVSYVTDCIKENCLLPVTDYR